MSNTIALIIAGIAPSSDDACVMCGNHLASEPHREVCFGEDSLSVDHMVGSLLTLDPFQFEGYMVRGEPRPVSYEIAPWAPGDFVRCSIEGRIDHILDMNEKSRMTRHELAYWGIAPKSELGKHYY
jgi:hypothetical protein